MILAGMRSSALEHEVPMKLLDSEGHRVSGISAVKALSVANDQGIPIYTITSKNISSVLQNLELEPDAIVDIQNAVDAGREVTVSQRNITFHEFIICGYIVMDPNTGDAAYVIDGRNGATFWLSVLWASLILLTIALATILTFIWSVIATIALATIGYLASKFILYTAGIDNGKKLVTLTTFLDMLVQLTLGIYLAATFVMAAAEGIIIPMIIGFLGAIFIVSAIAMTSWIIFWYTMKSINRKYIWSVKYA
jgi:hypothetical protein